MKIMTEFTNFLYLENSKYEIKIILKIKRYNK